MIIGIVSLHDISDNEKKAKKSALCHQFVQSVCKAVAQTPSAGVECSFLYRPNVPDTQIPVVSC